MKYFMITKKLTRQQACWIKLLSEFNFIILYISDKEKQKIDFLTCYSNDLSIDNNNNWQKHLL